MSGGISLNDAEAAITADSILANPDVTGSVTFGGLEDRIQSWIDGASTNNGWVISSNSTNGWDFDSSEGAIKPLLIGQLHHGRLTVFDRSHVDG